MLIGQPALEALNATLALGPIRDFAGDSRQVGLATADDATDEGSECAKMACLLFGQGGGIQLLQRVEYGTIAPKVVTHGLALLIFGRIMSLP